MKHIRSTLAALLVIGGASAAVAQQTQTQTPAHHRHAQADVAGKRGPGGHGFAERALFRGITLSDAEKANLKAVRAKYAPQAKALHEQFKPQHEAMREARQRGDTAALRQLFAKSADERAAAKRLFDAERNDLRGALTAQNQTKFDANIAKVEKRFAQRAAKGKPVAGKRGLHQ